MGQMGARQFELAQELAQKPGLKKNANHKTDLARKNEGGAGDLGQRAIAHRVAREPARKGAVLLARDLAQALELARELVNADGRDLAHELAHELSSMDLS